MVLWWYLACSVCFYTIHLCSSQNSYIALVPQVIRPGLVNFVHLNVLRGSGVEHLTTNLLDMTHGVKVISTSRSAVRLPGLARIPLTIPDNINSRRNYSIEVRGNGPVVFKDFTSVQVNEKSSLIFIETDKPTYRPGTLVKFRAFGINPSMEPVLAPMDIHITDSKGISVKRLIGVHPSPEEIDGSLQLGKIPSIGIWTIHAMQLGQKERKNFEVAVSPKFEVKFRFPSVMLTTDDFFRGEIEARYPFGKAVQGRIRLRIRQPSGKYIKLEFPVSGMSKFRLPMKEVIGNPFRGDRDVTVNADVMDTITGMSRSVSDTVQIYQTPEKIDFIKTSATVFKPGMIYSTLLFVTNRDKTPWQNPGYVNVTITYTMPMTHRQLSSPVRRKQLPEFPIVNSRTVTLSSKLYKIRPDGIVVIKFNHDGNIVPRQATNVNIKAYYRSSSAKLHLRRAYSKYNSYVQLQLLTKKPVVGGNIEFRMVASRPIRIFFFQITSKGSILRLGKIPMGGQRRDRTFYLILAPRAAPRAQVLIYYVHRGEIVADAVSFRLEEAPSNEMNIFENSERKLSNFHPLMLRYDANNRGSGNVVTRRDILREVQTFDTTIIKPQEWEWKFPIPLGYIDATSVFMNAGVKVMTDALLYQHERHIFKRDGCRGECPRNMKCICSGRRCRCVPRRFLPP